MCHFHIFVVQMPLGLEGLCRNCKEENYCVTRSWAGPTQMAWHLARTPRRSVVLATVSNFARIWFSTAMYKGASNHYAVLSSETLHLFDHKMRPMAFSVKYFRFRLPKGTVYVVHFVPKQHRMSGLYRKEGIVSL